MSYYKEGVCKAVVEKYEGKLGFTWTKVYGPKSIDSQIDRDIAFGEV